MEMYEKCSYNGPLSFRGALDLDKKCLGLKIAYSEITGFFKEFLH